MRKVTFKHGSKVCFKIDNFEYTIKGTVLFFFAKLGISVVKVSYSSIVPLNSLLYVTVNGEEVPVLCVENNSLMRSR